VIESRPLLPLFFAFCLGLSCRDLAKLIDKVAAGLVANYDVSPSSESVFDMLFCKRQQRLISHLDEEHLSLSATLNAKTALHMTKKTICKWLPLLLLLSALLQKILCGSSDPFGRALKTCHCALELMDETRHIG
jgi:hypothetical protein